LIAFASEGYVSNFTALVNDGFNYGDIEFGKRNSEIVISSPMMLVYADDVNLLGDNIDTIKKNTETLTDACKEVSLEVNAEKTKYMLLS
jgi:hypothetical protein